MKEVIIKFAKDKLHQVWQIENFRDLVFGCAERYRDKTAFRLSQQGRNITVTFQDLQRDYRRLCSTFFVQGLEGKPIAVMGKNSYAWALSYLAAATVGVVVPIDKELSGEDIDHFLATAGCKAVIGDRKLLDSISKQENVLYAATDEAQEGEQTVRSLTARGAPRASASHKRTSAPIFFPPQKPSRLLPATAFFRFCRFIIPMNAPSASC